MSKEFPPVVVDQVHSVAEDRAIQAVGAASVTAGQLG